MSRIGTRRGKSRAKPRRQHDYVFVVTYGRSGSTLVQGLLNALPRTLIRGENGFYIRDLFHAAQTAGAFRELYQGPPSRKPSSAFYGINHVTPGRFARSAERLVAGTLIGPDDPDAFDRIGFKEVLWHEIEPDETEAFFAWFDDVFPGAKYVLNSRAPENVVGSGFWQKQEPDEALVAINRVIEIQQFLRETRPDRVFDTRYEVITGDDRAASDATLEGLATFVTGSCDDALLGELRELLAVGHGPNPFGKSRGRRKAPAAEGNV